MRQFVSEAVNMAQRVWDVIMEKITGPEVFEHFSILDSPSQTWDHFVQYCDVTPTVEKARLELE